MSAAPQSDKQIQDLEIRVAYLERELQEYKDANIATYQKLKALEEEMKQVLKAIPEAEQFPSSSRSD